MSFEFKRNAKIRKKKDRKLKFPCTERQYFILGHVQRFVADLRDNRTKSTYIMDGSVNVDGEADQKFAIMVHHRYPDALLRLKVVEQLCSTDLKKGQGYLIR